MPEGTVTWFDPDKGFGFLTPDDGGPDVFVHARDVLVDDGPRALAEGQPVAFEVVDGERGPQAREVRPTGPAPGEAPLGVLATVSWFDAVKGYGFAVPDGGGEDVFVHATAVVTGGQLHEGQRVAFLVVPGERGPQAQHVLPLQDAAALPDDGADGTVTWYDAGKGFGFLTQDAGGPDVFVHYRSLAPGVEDLVEGQRVAFDVVESDRGPQARDVRPAGAATARPATARAGEGVVARYDEERGFGFISPDTGGDDLFVHVSVVRGEAPLRAGDRVRFGVRQSDRGPQADKVERLQA